MDLVFIKVSPIYRRSSAQKGTIRSAFRNAVLLAGTERERFTFIPGLESKGTEWSLGPFLLRSMDWRSLGIALNVNQMFQVRGYFDY